MKGEASVKLGDGRELTLVFDANAWIEAEEALGGMTTQEILARLQDKENPAGLKIQRALIFGGLRKHHPEMTIFDAGEIMVEAAEAMAKGIGGGMPREDGPQGDGEDGKKEADPMLTAKAKPHRGTGTPPRLRGRG